MRPYKRSEFGFEKPKKTRKRIGPSKITIQNSRQKLAKLIRYGKS